MIEPVPHGRACPVHPRDRNEGRFSSGARRVHVVGRDKLGHDGGKAEAKKRCRQSVHFADCPQLAFSVRVRKTRMKMKLRTTIISSIISDSADALDASKNSKPTLVSQTLSVVVPLPGPPCVMTRMVSKVRKASIVRMTSAIRMLGRSSG